MLDKIKKIYNEMSDIEYGWLDSSGNKHHHISEGYTAKYRFQSPDKLEKSRFGCCWETVALAKDKLEKLNIESSSYFLFVPVIKCYSHSILVVEDKEQNKVYWIELALKNFKGIHEYDSKEEMFDYIMDNFNPLIIDYEQIKKDTIKIYEYETPKDGTNCFAFYFNAWQSKNITSIYNKYSKK